MSIVEVVRKTTTVVEVAHPGVQGVPGAVDSVNSRTGAVVLTSADVGLGNVNNTSDASKPVSTAQAAADAAVLASANATTAAHAARTDNPHNVSAAQIGLGNVENKSSATIRSEITSGNVTTALGYTPASASSNTGDETVARIGALLHAAAAKTTPVDADEITGLDSAASFGLIRMTWANVKATLKTYFDTLYVPSAPTGGAAVGPITLFDTTAGDAFTALDWSGTDAGLTVTASKVTQNTAAVLNINASVKRAGSTLLHAVDCWSVEAVVKLKSWPATARGLYVGSKNTQGNNHFAAHVLDAGPVTYAFSRMTINGGDLYNYPGGYSLSGQPVTTIKMQRIGGDVHSVVNYAGAGDRPLDGTLVFAATSYELPRMFNDWCLNFGSGDLEVTALKVTAEYKNARFAFLGDSLTQGRFAATYADGFAAKIRADYPGDVLIAGAPSATSADWVANIEGIKMMTPKRVFIMLGTNDISMGVAFATYQANMTTIIAALESVGATVVLISIPPRGVSPTRTVWNPWLASLGKPYIDIYTPLATGDALNATYDSGDALHWNTAGHATAYTSVKSAITSGGW